MPASIHWEVTNLPKASVKTVQCVRADVSIGPYRTSANPCCLANFERKAFLPQTLNRNYSQIWCTVTGGAYHSARRVSTCVRNIRKSDSCLNRTAGCTPRPQAPFSPLSFCAGEKIGPPEARRKRPRRNEPPRCARSLLSSEPVSSFPNHKRSAGLWFGAGLDGTAPRRNEPSGARCAVMLRSSWPLHRRARRRSGGFRRADSRRRAGRSCVPFPRPAAWRYSPRRK